MAGVLIGMGLALVGAAPANAWSVSAQTDAAGHTYFEIKENPFRDEQNTMTIRTVPPGPALDVPNGMSAVHIRDTTARNSGWDNDFCVRFDDGYQVVCHSVTPTVYGPTEGIPTVEYAPYGRIEVSLGNLGDRLNIAPGGAPVPLTADLGPGNDYLRTPLDMPGAHVIGGDGADEIILRGALGGTSNYVDSGTGADQVDVRNARSDSVFCGADSDIAYFDLGESGSDCESTSESLPPAELP